MSTSKQSELKSAAPSNEGWVWSSATMNADGSYGSWHWQAVPPPPLPPPAGFPPGPNTPAPPPFSVPPPATPHWPSPPIAPPHEAWSGVQAPSQPYPYPYPHQGHYAPPPPQPGQQQWPGYAPPHVPFPAPPPPPGSTWPAPPGTFASQAAPPPLGAYGAPNAHAQPPYFQRPPRLGEGRENEAREATRKPPRGAAPLTTAMAAAIAVNKRITAAQDWRSILEIVDSDSESFDPVCLATVMHKLAGLRGAPGLHASIVQAPQFFKLKQIILDRMSEFTMRNLANTLWSLAKMNHHPGEPFLARLAERVKAEASGGNAQNLANAVWSFANLGYDPGSDVLEAIISALVPQLGQATSQNVSNVLIACAKLEWKPPQEAVRALGRAAAGKLSSCSAQALANSLWGLSRLEVRDEDLLRSLAAAACPRLPEFNSQNLANAVWAFANLGLHPGADFLTAVSAAARACMPEFSPQNISNTLWSFAKLDCADHALFAAAGEHALRIAHTMRPQSIANALWAFATAKIDPGAPFLQAVLSAARAQLAACSPQHLSNTAWALATLKDCASAQEAARWYVRDLLAEQERRLADPALAAEFSRQHLSNLMWALATLEQPVDRRLLAQLGTALAERAALCNAQEASNSVWAFAKMGHYCAPLMAAMAQETRERISEFSPQNLANAVWGVAKLAYRDDALMRAAAERALGLRGELSLQHVSNLAWAFATLDLRESDFVRQLVDETVARLGSGEELNTQQVSNLLWSLSSLDCLDHGVWILFLHQLEIQGAQPAGLPTEALSQIFQARLLQTAQHPEQTWELEPTLAACAKASWIRSTRVVTISEFQREVSRLLAAMGEEHTLEHLSADELFSMDMALPEEGLAVEADGPRHFTANTLQPLGEMRCRELLLRARNWTVVSVPFYHWSGAEDDQRRALLRGLLDDARALRGKEGGVAEKSAARDDEVGMHGAAVERAGGERGDASAETGTGRVDEKGTAEGKVREEELGQEEADALGKLNGGTRAGEEAWAAETTQLEREHASSGSCALRPDPVDEATAGLPEGRPEPQAEVGEKGCDAGRT